MSRVSSIACHDGTQVTLDHLSGQVSASLFQTDAHYDVCARVARAEAADEREFRVLHNLLSLKSRVLMGLTALLQDDLAQTLKVQRVILMPTLARAAGGLFAERGIEVEVLDRDHPLLPLKVAVAFSVKALLHRAYRLAARPLEAGRPLVRAWVDVTDAMYGELYPSAQVRLYPFAYGVGRQLAYARRLQSEGVRRSFDGVPYRWRDIPGVLLPGGRRHLRLARAERLAYERFAAELVSAGVREVYSSDEYEVAAVVAGECLREAGASYINTAHGIGLYCPQLAYSRFDYLNEYQAAFYRRMRTPMELRKRPRMNSRLPFEREQLAANEALSVVYVHQNFESYNLPSEIAAQAQILRDMAELGRRSNVDVAIKLHPNTPLAQLKTPVPPGLRIVSRWDELAGSRPIFLTIYSTAYYELAQVAPVLVYAAPTYAPAVYLDGEFQTFTHDDLGAQVAALRDPRAWDALVERQRQSLMEVAA